MGVEGLKRHLEARARADAKGMLEEARREAESVRAAALEEAGRKAAANAAIVADAERRARGLVVQAARDGTRAIGDACTEVVDKAAERALADLSALSGERYLGFISRSLAAGDKYLGVFVVTATRERDVPLLESEGRTVDGVVPGAGGIVMKAPDGRVLDLRFETLLEGMREWTWQMVVADLGVDMDGD